MNDQGAGASTAPGACAHGTSMDVECADCTREDDEWVNAHVPDSGMRHDDSWICANCGADVDTNECGNCGAWQ